MILNPRAGELNKDGIKTFNQGPKGRLQAEAKEMEMQKALGSIKST